MATRLMIPRAYLQVILIVVCIIPINSTLLTTSISSVGVNKSMATDSISKLCHIRAIDDYLPNKILQLLANKVKLINYQLNFVNYTTNPLLVNNTWSYQADKWARVSSQHGQTLLSLAFNYGVLSMMTLTLGVESMQVALEDEPYGCVMEMSEREKIDAVMFLLMHDFRDSEPKAPDSAETPSSFDRNVAPGYNGRIISIIDDERICHEVILNISGFAKFTDRCCHIDRLTNRQICTTEITNAWLSIVYGLLVFIKFSILFFGPLMFIPMIETIAKENIPYVVKLREPLTKKILLVKADTPLTYTYRKVLDLRRVKGFPKFKRAVDELPLGEPIKINVSQFDILVGYKKLMLENKVPVGMLQGLCRTIFQCRLSDMGPFQDCCHTDVMRSCDSDYEIRWIEIWQKVAKAMLVLLIPVPFYIRLVIFYIYENPEVQQRQAAVENLGLETQFEGNLIHYLGPTHPLFISMYVLYFCTAVTLGFIARSNRKGKFHKIILGSFQDLKNLSRINALGMVVSNVIWPFRRFGLVGCAVALIYWPIAVPISVIIFLFYCLPSIYITFRMLIHSRKNIAKKIFKKHNFEDGSSSVKSSKYAVRKEIDQSISVFETAALFGHISPSNNLDQDGFKVHIPGTVKVRRIIEHIFVATLCTLAMFSVLIIMSECVGFVVEVIVFTMMGVIVNASSVLKYTTLLFLVLIYSYDTFNKVERKYIKLNRSLFSEVKGRIKDIEKVTSLPSYLQENHGFKSQELSEQGEYEQSDDVAAELTPRQWLINDLVLFIDSEDMSRIPRQLFEDVCNIRVAGAPGPIYLSLLQATKSLMLTVGFLLFVFLVVLSFGEVYHVSTTNQMLATLAGGFLPFILKTFIQPHKPDIELGTVSFKNKLDEIIKNFYQNWPMYDFPFTVANEESEEASTTKELNMLQSGTGGCVAQACSCSCKHMREMSTQTQDELRVVELHVKGPTPFPSPSADEYNDQLSPLGVYNKKTGNIKTGTVNAGSLTGKGEQPAGPSTSTPTEASPTEEAKQPDMLVPESFKPRSATTSTLSKQPNSVAAIQEPKSTLITPISKDPVKFHLGPSSTSTVPSALVPPKVSVTLAKKASSQPKQESTSRGRRVSSAQVKTSNLPVPKASRLDTIRDSSNPMTSRRKTFAAIHNIPPEPLDSGITTIVSIPLGAPNLSKRRPTIPEPPNYGITTIRAPNFVQKASTAPESIVTRTESEAPRSPTTGRRMTATSFTTAIATPPLGNSSRRPTSPSAVENIPLLDRNTNIHNFLNSASDFNAWKGSSNNMDEHSHQQRKDSRASVLSDITSTYAVDHDHNTEFPPADFQERRGTRYTESRELSEAGTSNDEEKDVDLLVLLPEHPDNDLWLKEWSDMDPYEEVYEDSLMDQSADII